MEITNKLLKLLHIIEPCKTCGQETLWEQCNDCSRFSNGAVIYSKVAMRDYHDDNLNMIRDKIREALAWGAITKEEFILARDKWLRKHKKWLIEVKNKENDRLARKQKEFRDFYEVYISDRHM